MAEALHAQGELRRRGGGREEQRGRMEAQLSEALLPEVDPAARLCEGHPAPAGATCIEGGWFLMSRWTTAVLVDGGVHRRPLEPTYLDSFSLDVTEVTRGAYLDFVRSGDAGVLPPPPDCGGYMNVDDRYPEIGFSMRAERSGWTDAGTPVPGSKLAPVACVTRSEAIAFCAHRGGRLPTAFEFFRVVRGAFPSGRRLPWGDTPPALTGPDPVIDYQGEYAAVGLRGESRPPDVGTRLRGATDAGVVDLAGGVSEFLHECAEELDQHPFDGGFSIRPARAGIKTRCEAGTLVAGDNWYTTRRTMPMIGVTSVFVVKDYSIDWAGTPCPRLGALDVCLPGTAEDTLGASMPPSSWNVETSGNERRSWSLGFRCAYDVP
jgi:formylglycine-generating enzyme required for sulfatase activity